MKGAAMPQFLLIFGLPLAEIAAFVIVGGQIGVLATLAVVVLSSVAGVLVLRSGGRHGLVEVRQAMGAGRGAGQAIARQAFTGIAAVMLIVPGLLTSAFGVILLLPPVQRILTDRITARMRSTRPTERPAQGEVIEGDYADVTSRRPHPDSPWSDRDSRTP
jgi:UPF0716 protein FxsA